MVILCIFIATTRKIVKKVVVNVYLLREEPFSAEERSSDGIQERTALALLYIPWSHKGNAVDRQDQWLGFWQRNNIPLETKQ